MSNVVKYKINIRDKLLNATLNEQRIVISAINEILIRNNAYTEKKIGTYILLDKLSEKDLVFINMIVNTNIK